MEAIHEVQFKIGDKSYTMPPPNYATQRRYAHFLESCAIRRVCAHRNDYPPEVFKMQLDSIRDGFASKRMAWGSEAWHESLQDDEQSQHLAFLMLTQEKSVGSGPMNDATEEWVAEVWETPYTDEGDLYFQTMKASGIEPTVGGKMASIIWTYLTRKNSQAPQEAGDKSTTS